MSKFKKNFTLKQHTPIIHFQGGQRGATLRATELKPKFDRFLLENIKDIPYKENPNGHKSLDYKVKIEQNLTPATQIDSNNSLFFGNMGDGEEKKYKSYNKTFKIEFFSYNYNILEAISNYFEAFLANTNFGTRQSKGYGSFYIDKKSFDKTLVPYKVYSFSSNNWEKDIKLLYQFLRQGINLPRPRNPFYSKPAIFAYAKNKGWTWDKKVIKEKFFSSKLQQQINKHNSDILTFNSDKKYLLRDLFGLSSSQEWMSYGKTITKEHKKKEIERFKSPITFKVIDKQVYFWVNDSYKKILDKEFTIKGNGSLDLNTPTEFDFDDFLRFAFDIDLSKHIDSEFHGTVEYNKLQEIFKSIKADV